MKRKNLKLLLTITLMGTIFISHGQIKKMDINKFLSLQRSNNFDSITKSLKYTDRRFKQESDSVAYASVNDESQQDLNLIIYDFSITNTTKKGQIKKPVKQYERYNCLNIVDAEKKEVIYCSITKRINQETEQKIIHGFLDTTLSETYLEKYNNLFTKPVHYILDAFNLTPNKQVIIGNITIVASSCGRIPKQPTILTQLFNLKMPEDSTYIIDWMNSADHGKRVYGAIAFHKWYSKGFKWKDKKLFQLHNYIRNSSIKVPTCNGDCNVDYQKTYLVYNKFVKVW